MSGGWRLVAGPDLISVLSAADPASLSHSLLPLSPLQNPHLSDDRSRREGREGRGRVQTQGEGLRGGEREREHVATFFPDLISDPRVASRVTSGAPRVTEVVDDGSV